MRRLQLRRDVRDVGPPLFLAYLFLHATAVLGLTTPRYSDSSSYMHLSLTGHDVRLPTVPLFYKLLPTDGLRVAGQALLAAGAWWVLANSASRMVTDTRLRTGLRVVLLALGLTAPIANWNTTILSESTAISLTALLIAAWLRYVQDKRWGTAGPALAVTLLWTFTRQPNVLFGVMIAGTAAVAAVAWRDARRVRVIVAAVLVLITAAGFAELRNNQTLSKGVLVSTIQGRVLLHPDWSAWFRRHGMPAPRFDPREHRRAVPLNPAFRAWIDSKGIRTYVRFVLSHPDYTLFAPLPYLSGEESSLHAQTPDPYSLGPNPKGSIFSPSVTYGRIRRILPSPIDDFLFDQGNVGLLLLLAGFAAGLTWTQWKRGGWDRRWTVPLLLVVSALPQAYVIWLSGGETTHEIDRLSMITAVSLRVGVWVLVAVALDRLLTLRRSEPARAVA